MTLIQLIAWVILEPIIYGPLMRRVQVLRVVSSEHLDRTVISSFVRTSRLCESLWKSVAWGGSEHTRKDLATQREEDQYLFMREKKNLTNVINTEF